MPTLTGKVTRNGEHTVTLSLSLTGLPEDAMLHLDDSADGSFAGASPECTGCGNHVGYLHGDTPSTMEQAYAAVFIPVVEHGEALYCLTCVIDGTAEFDGEGE
jgi:hypothetical protein